MSTTEIGENWGSVPQDQAGLGAARRSVVKGTLKVVLELVQKYMGIGRGNDHLLARYVAAENPPGGSSLLLGMEAANELDFRLWA